MQWIYASPHFDDVALSCGGLVWEQAQSGHLVNIWTVCAGKPPSGDLSPFATSFHLRWKANQDAPTLRRSEDMLSCQLLGAGSYYFNIPDCIYRRNHQTGGFLYASEEALTGELQPADAPIISWVQEEVARLLSSEACLVSPLSLGNHIDHQLTRTALEGLGHPLWFYEDYPYVLRCTSWLEEMSAGGWTSHTFPITEPGLSAWQDSIAAHASQISTFWNSEDEMRRAITQHLEINGGIRLWRMPSQ